MEWCFQSWGNRKVHSRHQNRQRIDGYDFSWSKSWFNFVRILRVRRLLLLWRTSSVLHWRWRPKCSYCRVDNIDYREQTLLDYLWFNCSSKSINTQGYCWSEYRAAWQLFNLRLVMYWWVFKDEHWCAQRTGKCSKWTNSGSFTLCERYLDLGWHWGWDHSHWILLYMCM